MAPSIPRAELTLSFPIYASSFDPRNDAFLLVGGGGGEGRSGVDNKITLIDSTRATKLHEIHDIVLSRDEDSVTSLAIARSTDTGATAFAGINSSSKEMAKGVNEHLRSFLLPYPATNPADDAKGSEAGEKEEKAPTMGPSDPPKALGKVALFDDAVGKQETYQRIIRLSPLVEGGGPRLAAIATGLAPFGEITVFDVSKDTPTVADVRRRIKLQKNEEAADVDLIPRKTGDFELVYCTDYDVCVCTVSAAGKLASDAPKAIYTTPHPDVFASKKRPTFRAVRFLTPNLLAVICNLPERSGSEVLLMEIPTDRARGAKIVHRKRLHRGIKSATSLATALLPTPHQSQNIQHVLAIAGQDISVTILTLDHPPASTTSLKLKKHALLKDVHAVQMTSLAFSHFTPPTEPAKASAQYLKLASTSMGGTVVVNRFPLRVYPPVDEGPSRYCLSFPGRRAEIGQIGVSILITIMMAALSGILIQALTEIRGGSPDYIGAKNWLSESMRERFAVPYMFAEAPVIASSMPTIESIHTEVTKTVISAASAASESAASILPHVEAVVADLPHQVKQAVLDYHAVDSGDQKPLLLRDTQNGVEAATHSDVTTQGRKWEDLEHHERSAWQKKLVSAGKWTEGQLETVLKGVLFGELAGAVANAVD